MKPIDIADRMELFVDDLLVAESRGVSRRLGEPSPREVAMTFDRPWEGNGCGYFAVFRDGGVYRMYYKSWHIGLAEGKLAPPHKPLGCYAESTDGVTWHRPSLGLVEFEGSTDNNIVWGGPGGHDFGGFRDENPAAGAEARYKCVASGNGGLLAFQSPDGLRWSPLNDGEPVMTGAKFDTQNIAFWDAVRGQYRAYIRDFEGPVRGIKTATSADFINWSPLEWLEYPGSPVEALYTNQVQPYYRAPHIFVGLPARYVERKWGPSHEALPGLEHRLQRRRSGERYASAVTDSLFMASRDGRTFTRHKDVFLRPLQRERDNWCYGDNYLAWGMFETPSPLIGGGSELSLFATEAYWVGSASRVRRYAIRIDGFVSMHADLDGGWFRTPPLTFIGGQLELNFATSAAGVVRVELQDAGGRPMGGYSLDECDEIFGDSLQRTVTWQGRRDLSGLAGKPVRLAFELKQADLYSLRFR